MEGGGDLALDSINDSELKTALMRVAPFAVSIGDPFACTVL